MLMLVYDLNADNAVQLLKWGSKAGRITVPHLARRLIDDAEGPARDGDASDHVDLRSACDDVLFAVHEQCTPVADEPLSFSQGS